MLTLFLLKGSQSEEYYVGCVGKENVVTGVGVDESVRDFYADLYSGKEGAEVQEIQEYCQVLQDVLSPQDKDMLAAEMTELELLEAVKSMQRNKTPGRDGLLVEFLKFLWPVLGKHFF